MSCNICRNDEKILSIDMPSDWLLVLPLFFFWNLVNQFRGIWYTSFAWSILCYVYRRHSHNTYLAILATTTLSTVTILHLWNFILSYRGGLDFCLSGGGSCNENSLGQCCLNGWYSLFWMKSSLHRVKGREIFTGQCVCGNLCCMHIAMPLTHLGHLEPI